MSTTDDQIAPAGGYQYPHSVASLPVLTASPRDHPAPSGESPSVAPAISGNPTLEKKLLEGKIIAALCEVYDPEIPVNIYELGLIYEIIIAEDKSVKILMTLTAPACPVAGSLPGEVARKVETVPEVTSAEVELIWEPPWDKSRMSEAAQLQLNLF